MYMNIIPRVRKLSGFILLVLTTSAIKALLLNQLADFFQSVKRLVNMKN